MGLGEYEQRYWNFRDDNGATFIQAPCGDILKSWSMPAPKSKSPTEKPSQRSRYKTPTT
jgi:hypothetical protein